MNTMKEVKIIQSKTEPNKNHLWLSDEGLKQFKGNGWEQVLSNDNGGSGGGSTDPNDENYVEYLDVSNNEDWNYAIELARTLATLKNVTAEQKDGTIGVFIISPYMQTILEGTGEVTNIQDRYLEIYPNKKFTQTNPVTNVYELKSVMQMFRELETLPLGQGVLEQYRNLPRITKEEFYNLNE